MSYGLVIYVSCYVLGSGLVGWFWSARFLSLGLASILSFFLLLVDYLRFTGVDSLNSLCSVGGQSQSRAININYHGAQASVNAKKVIRNLLGCVDMFIDFHVSTTGKLVYVFEVISP